MSILRSFGLGFSLFVIGLLVLDIATELGLVDDLSHLAYYVVLFICTVAIAISGVDTKGDDCD